MNKDVEAFGQITKLSKDMSAILKWLEEFKKDKTTPPTEADLKAFGAAMDKLDKDLQATKDIITKNYSTGVPGQLTKEGQELMDGVKQVENTMNMIYKTPATGIPDGPSVEDLLKFPSGLAQLAILIQSWASGKDAKGQVVENKLIIFTDKGGKVPGTDNIASSVQDMGTQLSTKISDDNQKLQTTATQYQQVTDTAKNLMTAQTKGFDNWVHNQRPG